MKVRAAARTQAFDESGEVERGIFDKRKLIGAAERSVLAQCLGKNVEHSNNIGRRIESMHPAFKSAPKVGIVFGGASPKKLGEAVAVRACSGLVQTGKKAIRGQADLLDSPVREAGYKKGNEFEICRHERGVDATERIRREMERVVIVEIKCF